MSTFPESITPGETSLDRIQREQCNDFGNYVETQLLMVQAWKFVRFEARLDTCSDTMLNSMKHGITSSHEFKSYPQYLNSPYCMTIVLLTC